MIDKAKYYKEWLKHETRETINVSTISVIHFFNGYLSEASVIDSRYVLESLLNKATGL